MDNQLALIEGGAPPSATEAAAPLCAYLAQRIGERTGFTPNHDLMSWHRAMRLLMEKGPTGVDQPLDAAYVKLTIDRTYDNETWWADKITHPDFLRKHFPRIAQAARESVPAVPVEQKAAAADVLRNL